MRVLSVGLVLLALFAPRSEAQDAGIVIPPCEIRGHLTVERVHGRGGALRTIEDRDVRVTPLGHGAFQVRTHGGTPRVEGRTESAIPLVLSGEHVFANIATVATGTRIDAIEPRGDGFRGAIAIDDGVSLEDVSLVCRDLAATPPTDAALDTVALRRGPVWRARVPRLRIRASSGDETTPLVIEMTPDARRRLGFVERQRDASWVRVEVAFAHAHLLGWTRDTDLALP